MKKLNIFGALIFAAGLFSSCANTEFDSVTDKYVGDSLIATYSIRQVIDSFVSNKDAYSDLKYSATNSGLFTCDIISSNKDVVFNGVVTSTDAGGNVYKYLTIENFKTKQAMKISINASGISSMYPVGQKVWVQCNNLYIGKYAQGYQMGWINYNSAKFIISGTDTVYRKEPGRIALPIAQKMIHRYGMPDTTLVRPDTLTIAQIKLKGDSIINRLVVIKNAFFTGKGVDYNLPASISYDEMIFAPSTNGVGYPQSREIQDGTGSMFVSTSEYAKFAKLALPESNIKGNITAIVGWYNDKKVTVKPSSSTAEIYYQLTLRTIKDLGKGFEKYHQQVGQ